MPIFRDRSDAGRKLSAELEDYREKPNAIVLALPRGGVPVGYEVARALRLPLDAYIVRKLGVPGHDELAMGALASDGSYVVDRNTIELAHVSQTAFEATLARELAELKRREAAYRDERPEPQLMGKAVILVDDGLATGASMYAAVSALRQRKPAQIVVAVPTAPAETCRALERVADRVVCPYRPEPFIAVGLYYHDFEQVGDDDVKRLLIQADRELRQWKAA